MNSLSSLLITVKKIMAMISDPRVVVGGVKVTEADRRRKKWWSIL